MMHILLHSILPFKSKMEKEKILKNKRMSLDPAKNPLIGLQKHHNATELEVRNTSHEESQSIINKESDPYPSE